MSNLPKGFDRASGKEFHKFIVVAKGSCAEVRSLLYVALDAGLVSKKDFHAAMRDAQELARILAGLRSAVSRQISTAKVKCWGGGGRLKDSGLRTGD